jgi:hypothetical protein
MAIFFLPPLIQNRGGGIERRPARGEGAPAVPPMAAAGKWLKMERRPRGINPRAHLVLGWSEGEAPREGGGLAAVLRGGGAVELGEGGEVAVEVRGGLGSGRPLFIGGERRFGRGFLELGKLQQWRWRWKYLVVDPFRQGCGRDSRWAAVLCDWICRAGARRGGRATRWRVRQARL